MPGSYNGSMQSYGLCHIGSNPIPGSKVAENVRKVAVFVLKIAKNVLFFAKSVCENLGSNQDPRIFSPLHRPALLFSHWEDQEGIEPSSR